MRAAVRSAIPGATIYQDDSTFPVEIYVPDPHRQFPMKVLMHESGKLFSLYYGSAEGSAAFVERVLHTFPPPDDVEVLLYEWEGNPRVTAATTARNLLSIVP